MPSDIEPKRLSEAVLAARGLRKLTGLTYRQLNEWDRRAALPNHREGEGWRRVTGWHALSLAVTSDLHNRFGVPLVRQRGLTRWLLGEDSTFLQAMQLHMAEDRLAAISAGEAEAIAGALHARGQQGRGLAEPGEEAASVQYPPLLDDLARELSRRLVGRGWPPSLAAGFATKFVAVSEQRIRGLDGATAAIDLIAQAKAVGDATAGGAARILGVATLPLYHALVLAQAGHDAFLVTDLQSHQILDGETYVANIRAGVLPASAFVVRLNPPLDRVLEQVATWRLPPARSTKQNDTNADERRILELIRGRDFARLSVEPLRAGFRLQVEREVPADDPEAVARLIAEHPYQSVTAKVRDGRLARLVQAVSEFTGAAADGTNPRRKGQEV